MKKVKVLLFNWCQVGSTETRDGAGEDFTTYEVAPGKAVSITEDKSALGLFSYIVVTAGGKTLRVFNPNHVEYLTEEPTNAE